MRGDRGGSVPDLVSQTLSSDSPPAPAPTLILSRNSQGSLPSPRRACSAPSSYLRRRAAAPGEGGPSRSYLRSQRGPPAPAALLPRSHPQCSPRYPAPLSRSEQLVEECARQVSAWRQRRLPSPVSRKDSLLFCASALFLWRGRSRDSSRALVSAPCISPMGSGGRARSGLGRQENTDVSLKEPP